MQEQGSKKPKNPRWLRWTPVKILGSGSFGIAILVTRKSNSSDEDVSDEQIDQGATVTRVIKIFWDSVTYAGERVISVTTSAYQIEMELSREINRKFIQSGLCPHFVKTTAYAKIPLIYLIKGISEEQFDSDVFGYSFSIDPDKAPMIDCDLPFSPEELEHIRFRDKGIWLGAEELRKQLSHGTSNLGALERLIHPNKGLGVPCVGILEMEYVDYGELRTIRKALGVDNHAPMLADDAKSIALQLYSIWDCSKMIGFQHRDVNTRNILVAHSNSRANCSLSRDPAYHLRGGLTYKPPLYVFSVVLADYSLSHFSRTHPVSLLESPVVAPHCRPPELYFFSGFPVEYYLGASDLFSMGLCFAATLLSYTTKDGGPLSGVRLQKLKTSPNYVQYSKTIDEEAEYQINLGVMSHGYTFSGFKKGTPNHFGYLHKRNQQIYPWNICSLVGTSADWGKLKSTPLWKLMEPHIPNTDEFREGALFLKTGKYYPILHGSLGDIGMKMLRAMLTPNPELRETKYSEACQQYFASWRTVDSSDKTLTSIFVLPLDRSNWGIQLGLRSCYDVSSGAKTLNPIPIGSAMNSRKKKIGNDLPMVYHKSESYRRPKLCVRCGRLSKMITKFEYSPVDHLCDVPDSIVSFHVCSQKCSDFIFKHSGKTNFIRLCADAEQNPALLAYYKNLTFAPR